MIFKTVNQVEPLPSTSIKVRLSYWLLTHWSAVRRWAMVGLIAADALLLGWAGWKLLPIIRDPGLIDRVVQDLTQLPVAVPAKPEPLIISPVTVLPNNRGADLVATITNPNENRLAMAVRYVFVTEANVTTTVGWTWLGPGQTRYVVTAITLPAAAADLKIISQKWQRSESPATALNIKISEAVLEPAGDQQPARVSFMAANDESIGFKQVWFTIVIKNYSGQPVAAGTALMENLAPGASRTGTVSWYGGLSGGGQIIVEPLTDLWDPNNLFVNSASAS